MKKVKKEKEYICRHSCVSNLTWASKNLWRMDKAYWLYALPEIPISILLGLAGSFYPKLLIDMLEATEPFQKIALVTLLFFGGLLLLTLFRNYSAAQFWGRRYTISNRYQNFMGIKESTTDYEHLEQQKFRKLGGFAWSDLCQGNSASEYFLGDLQRFIIQLLGIITLASLMAVLNPVIFIVIIVVSAFSYILTRWEARYTESHKDNWEKESRKSGYLEGISEDFARAKDIKLYGMQNWINRMMHDYQAHVRMWQNRCSLRGMWAAVLSGILTLLQDGTAYILLIGMLFAGEIGVGDFVFFFGIVGSVASYLSGIIGSVAELVRRGEKIGYVRDYLETEEHFNHGPGCELPTRSELPVKIEFKDVWYRYEGAEEDTLKGINLTIEAGEKLALVGINGAGKTTLMKLLCAFYAPTKGEILVNGKKITEYNLEEYFTLISAVFQDIDIPAMTICEFTGMVDYEKGIDRERARKALVAAGLGDKLDSLPQGMDTYLRKGIYPDAIDLSGGEAQKLMLARAIYKNGEVLILDEPTAALDPIAENQLYMEYSELTKEKTSVYISHRFASTRFCDKIALLEEGVIKELGTHEELMKQNGRYAYMFGVQSKYYQKEVN